MPTGGAAKKKSPFRFVALGLTGFVVLVAISLIKEYIRSYQIAVEIEQLRDQIASLEQENAQTSNLVEYLKTDSYFQKQARIKLGMKAPGEKVIVLEHSPQVATGAAPSVPAGTVALQTFQRDERVNPQKWFEYFFGK